MSKFTGAPHGGHKRGHASFMRYWGLRPWGAPSHPQKRTPCPDCGLIFQYVHMHTCPLRGETGRKYALSKRG